MATGIAQAAAQTGLNVVVRGRSQDSVDACIGGYNFLWAWVTGRNPAL